MTSIDPRSAAGRSRAGRGAEPDHLVTTGLVHAADQGAVGQLGHGRLSEHPVGGVELGFQVDQGLGPAPSRPGRPAASRYGSHHPLRSSTKSRLPSRHQRGCPTETLAARRPPAAGRAPGSPDAVSSRRRDPQLGAVPGHGRVVPGRSRRATGRPARAAARPRSPARRPGAPPTGTVGGGTATSRWSVATPPTPSPRPRAATAPTAVTRPSA